MVRADLTDHLSESLLPQSRIPRGGAYPVTQQRGGRTPLRDGSSAKPRRKPKQCFVFCRRLGRVGLGGHESQLLPSHQEVRGLGQSHTASAVSSRLLPHGWL